MEIYVVQPGDTVNRIAGFFGVNINTIIFDNQLVSPYRLAVGQALLIQTEGTAAQNPAGRRFIRSNGYAYPFIGRWVLEQTLPFLTEVSVFSYGFTPEGNLVPPALSEDWMLREAQAAGVLPVLTLTPLDVSGRFSNYLISQIVHNPESRERLIENLLGVMAEKGYGGLDIDFEYILAQDRDAFTEFVQVCAARMHEAGYRVTVALAPKTSADQKGLLYEGKDYPALGAAADAVLLMTYEWGYAYGPPMAIAPLNKVRQVVEYAVTEIAPQKIYLGIPNYGYDWPLPFEAGTTKARTIGNIEAVQIAVANGAEIQFDETAQSPYFRYARDGIWHEVWFEDVRSLQGKFNLIGEFDLLGAGYWNIMQFFRANWLLLHDFFGIQKAESRLDNAALQSVY